MGVGEGLEGERGRVGRGVVDHSTQPGENVTCVPAHTKHPQWNQARRWLKKKKGEKDKVLLHQLKNSGVLCWFDVGWKHWLGIARSAAGPLPTRQAGRRLSLPATGF